MGPPRTASADCRGSGGFALIIVLWTLALIAFITAQLVGTGRVEIRIASNLIGSATAEAAADGAVYQAIFGLLDPDPGRRWALDGNVRQFAIGDCGVTVRVEDEAARINPNLAPRGLVEALLRTTGSDAATAQRLSGAIGQWVGMADAPRPPDAVLSEYRAAGRNYGPPAEPLETLDELRRVLGMTPGVFAAIRPHLSLFAAAVPSLTNPDPVVAAAMAAIAGPGGTRSLLDQSDLLIARVGLIAQCRNDARARRTVVVRVSPASRTYTTLSWEEGNE
jgi:general secretion pathway protein K